MRKKYINVPSLKIRFESDLEHEFAENLIKRGIYQNFFTLMIKKIVRDPSILSDNPTTKKVNNDNKEELTEITKILQSMNSDQTAIKEQLTKMADEVNILRELTNKQHNTLTETVNLLSSTQEGLELLKKLNEEAKIDLVKVVEETKIVKEETESNIKPIAFANPPSISADPLGEDDGFEFDDEFSREELEEMAKAFKRG